MIDRIKKNKVFLIINVAIIIVLVLMTKFNNKYLVINEDTNPYEGYEQSQQSTMEVTAGGPVFQYSYFIFNIAVSTLLTFVALVITNNRNNTLKFKWIISLVTIILYAFTRWGVSRYVGSDGENVKEIYRGFIGASVLTVLYMITLVRYAVKRPKEEVKKEIKEEVNA